MIVEKKRFLLEYGGLLSPAGEVVKKGQAYVELEAMTHGCGIH